MSAKNKSNLPWSAGKPTYGAYEYNCSKEYSSKLLLNLHGLWQNKDFCDVRLAVGGKVYEAHRCVLTASSPYFHAMFTNDLSEKSNSEIHIHEIDAPIFEKLLQFIYCGKIEVNQETCQDILTAADMLEISEVVTACCSFLKKEMHPSNCIGMYMFSEARAFTDLKSTSEAFIYNNFMAVTQEEEFNSLPRDILIHILQSESLHIECEFQVFTAAMQWILHEVKERRSHIFDIMSTIRFPLIQKRKLEKYMYELTDISLKIALFKYMQSYSIDCPLDAKKPHLKPYMFCNRKGARKKIFVIGGYSRHRGGRWSDSQSLSSSEYFDSFHEHWTASLPLHHARSGHGVISLNGKIYVIGGESDSLIYDSVECFDPSTNEWSMVASLTLPRCGLGVCTLEGAIYAIGGWIGSQIGDSIERYDPEANQWSLFGKLESLRYSMGVTVYEDLIYIVGGISETSTEMNLVESYNPLMQEFSRLADMREKRAHLGLAALDGYIYAVGGWNEYKGALSTVERYSITEDRWEDVAAMTSGRAGASVIALNGRLFVMGGRSENEEFSAPATLELVECFDPQRDCWFTLTSMSASRCEAGAAMI